MANAEKLPRDLDHIEQQISALQDYLYESELYPKQDRPWARFRRAVSLFLIRRYVFRQIQQLYLRRQIIHNCYQYVHEQEPENRSIAENARMVRTYHP